jgi:hypothetical protein
MHFTVRMAARMSRAFPFSPLAMATSGRSWLVLVGVAEAVSDWADGESLLTARGDVPLAGCSG